ncbi:MAG: DinB family protein [Chloroflexi bacterium]|nr:MAG: DinB family protein [Chloroflexota bacterium]
MEFELDAAIEILKRTPKILETWLLHMPDGWVMNNEGGNSWNAFDIVGHFIHGELTDWIPRAELILSAENDVPEFEPFDRFAQFETSKGKPLPELLTSFAELRQKNLETLEAFNLQPSDYERQGKHPELGSVNLRQLLATWTVHDLNHLGQIAQVMASQYQDAVGPWQDYLGILHSEQNS